MLPFALITGGALGIALTTALEVLTAPYSAHVVAYPLNGAVHVLKILAVAAFVAGMAGYLVRFRERLGVIGLIAGGALAVGTFLAGPYNLAEVSLDGSLSAVAANAQLQAIYAAQPWITQVSSVALPAVLLGIVVFGIVALRRRLFPTWAPVFSLATIPIAFGAAILSFEAGLPVPHPPTWLFLGLAGYGLSGIVLRLSTRSTPSGRSAR